MPYTYRLAYRFFFIILQQLVSLYKFNMWGKWQHSTCSSFWTWHRFYRAITVKTPCSTPHAYWAASMVAYSRACFCLFLFSLQWAPSIPASFSYLSSLPSTCLLHQLHHSQIFLFIQSPVLSSRIFKISTRVLEVLLCPVFSTIICLHKVVSLGFADVASRDMSAEACRNQASRFSLQASHWPMRYDFGEGDIRIGPTKSAYISRNPGRIFENQVGCF